MKTYLLFWFGLLGLCLLPWCTQAQQPTLVGAEYYFNTDPGFGNGVSIPFSSGTTVSQQVSIGTEALPDGFHRFFVRFRDNEGVWGLTANRLFWKGRATTSLAIAIDAAEYFFGNDPGIGNGTALSVTAGPNPQILGIINVADLPRGFHRLSIRFRNQSNIWGLAASRLFFVEREGFKDPSVVDYVEYFFNSDDPGLGNATEIPLDEIGETFSIDALIATSELPVGEYTLTVRVLNTKGLWSIAETREFTVGEPVPPVPDVENLPDFISECIVNFADLSIPTATAQDGKTVVGVTNESIFPITQQGSRVITWTYTDANGFRSTQEQRIILDDVTAPTISMVQNIQLNADLGQCFASGVALIPPDVADNCGSVSLTNDAPSIFPVGLTPVTWTATDGNGNQAFSSFEVLVIDTQAPSITCPETINRLVPFGSTGAVIAYSLPTSIDNCGTSTLTLVEGLASGEEFPLGTTLVRYVASDASGNSSECSFNVVIIEEEDGEPPVIINCPDSIVVPNTQGSCSAVVGWVAPTATDNSGSVTFNSNFAPGASFPVGTTRVIYTATDAAGNTTLCEFDITVQDTQAPVFTCTQNITVTVGFGEDSAIVNYPIPTATDNCGEANVQLVNGLASGSLFPLGITTVIFSATDAVGNASQCSFTVTVAESADTELPVINNCPGIIEVSNDQGACGAIVTWIPPTALDNSGSVQLVTDVEPGSFFPIGSSTVTYTATDPSGNSTICTFNIIVNDNQAPVITCPDSIELTVGIGVAGINVTYELPEATDNCNTVNLLRTAGPASGSIFSLGTTTVSYTATDDAGNSSSCSFTVTVTASADTEPPVISNCPISFEVSNDDGECGAIVTWVEPMATDNSGSVTLTSDIASGSFFPVGVTTVFYTAVDGAGNSSTCFFEVRVEDNEAPSISCPSPIAVVVGIGEIGAFVNYDLPVATDNCGAVNIELISGPASGSLFSLGTTTVSYTATDDAGNSSSCSFTVTVTASADTEPPVISNCPISFEVSNDDGECGAIVTWTEPTATDNSGSVTLTSDIASGSFFPVGVTTVTYTAVDGAGNSSTCSFEVRVEDNEAPSISCSSPIAVVVGIGEIGAFVNYDLPVATDNCGAVNIELISGPASGSLFSLGTTTVSYTATDDAGNSSSCSFTVTVTASADTEPPVISNCPISFEVSNDDGECGAIVTWVEPMATDNSGSVTLTSDIASGSFFPVGVTTVFYTAVDGAGNSSTCFFEVRVEDEEAPSISAPGNITIQVDLGSETASNVELGIPTVMDNCGLESVTNNAPESFSIGTTDVTWTAIDQAGNRSISIQRVIVVPRDTEVELPTISPPDKVLVNADDGECSASNVNLGLPTVTGNIPDGGIVNDAPERFPVGITTVTWTVTDINGNTATATQMVTVKDNVPPVISAPENIHITLPAGQKEAHDVNLGMPEVSDNCTIKKVSNNAPKCFPVGITEVIWTVVDESGNKATAVQLVEVKKAEACEVIAKAKPVVILKLNSAGKARLILAQSDDGSSASCGPLKLELSKCDFTCADLGENTVRLTARDARGNRDRVEFTVVVVDEQKPKVKANLGAFVWMMRSGDTFTMPDFRRLVQASDNCGVELKQYPAPGAKFRKPENFFVEFEAVDPSGNVAKAKFRFRLLVFKCKVPNKKNGRDIELEDAELLTVPWNTSLEWLVAEGIEFEEGSDEEAIKQILWEVGSVDGLSTGFHQMKGMIRNEGFDGLDATVSIPILVTQKPMPEDIILSENVIPNQVQLGTLIGNLSTIDTSDKFHTYSMDEHPNFFLDGEQLKWKGTGSHESSYRVVVHSTDRVGQTISKELVLYRDVYSNSLLIYPNPAAKESNILVQLSGESDVTMRIFDATGRVVFEERVRRSETFVRNLDLTDLSAGLYHVVVQIDHQVLSGRLVKGN